MRFKMLRLWTAGIIGIFVAVGCHNEGAKHALTPAEAKDISREAYTFGLPLVYIGLMFDVNTGVANPEGTRAPVNQFAHVREFPDAKANPIVGMNVDTLYSLASLDLSQEPIILSIPEMGKPPALEQSAVRVEISLWLDPTGTARSPRASARFAVIRTS